MQLCTYLISTNFRILRILTWRYVHVVMFPLRGQAMEKSTFFKELTPHSWTYELRSQWRGGGEAYTKSKTSKQLALSHGPGWGWGGILYKIKDKQGGRGGGVHIQNQRQANASHCLAAKGEKKKLIQNQRQANTSHCPTETISKKGKKKTTYKIKDKQTPLAVLEKLFSKNVACLLNPSATGGTVYVS